MTKVSVQMCGHSRISANAQVTMYEERPGEGSVDSPCDAMCVASRSTSSGLPRGLDMNGAAVSPDGTEARLAIGVGEDWMAVPGAGDGGN